MPILLIIAGLAFAVIAVIQSGGLWTRASVIFWAGLAAACFLVAAAIYSAPREIVAAELQQVSKRTMPSCQISFASA